MRNDAAHEMELAIKSFKLKFQNTEVAMVENANPEENAVAKTEIAEMKELIGDMEQRVSLPISISGMLAN